MTTPIEQTRTPTQTREFLRELVARTYRDAVPDSASSEATRLLRHFPVDVELTLCGRVLPHLFADPTGTGR